METGRHWGVLFRTLWNWGLIWQFTAPSLPRSFLQWKEAASAMSSLGSQHPQIAHLEVSKGPDPLLSKVTNLKGVTALQPLNERWGLCCHCPGQLPFPNLGIRSQNTFYYTSWFKSQFSACFCRETNQHKS